MAVIDDFYSFTPSAQDPERRPLTFSISNKPAWASFSANTGKLSGMPESSQIGSHVDIEISVSDGLSRTVLPPFMINVLGRGDGSATLSWYPPTNNTDGSYLTDLAGYRINFGRRKHSLNRTIVLNNPGLTRYMVEGLTPARWYFSMTAVDQRGTESRQSKIVSKKVS